MHVDISCRQCGQRQRLDIGTPADGDRDAHCRLLSERLAHQASFQCFGGHFELRPALPEYWEIHWETLGD